MTVTPNLAQLKLSGEVGCVEHMGIVCGMCWQLQLQGRLGSTWVVTDCVCVHEVCDDDV